MDALIEFREKIQGAYAKHAVIFDKAIQLITALLTFYEINSKVGYMSAATSPVITLALAVLCTLLPPVFIVLGATVLILAHMYAVSLGLLIVVALVFAVMYIFFFRLTPKKSMIVLLTPLALVFRIPFVVPVGCALMDTTSAIVTVACGTVTYYMLEYVRVAASGLTGEDAPGLIEQLSTCSRQIFQNEELWVMLIALMIGFMTVYLLRRQSMNHAWTIAVIVGTIVWLVVQVAGAMALGVSLSYTSMVIGAVASIVVGVILELFFFAVDYSRCENLQYEDDDYYYYVKAVPKLNVPKQEKQVQHMGRKRREEA